MAQQLRAQTALPEALSSIASTASSGAQSPVPLDPGDPTSLASIGTCTHVHIPIHTFTHI